MADESNMTNFPTTNCDDQFEFGLRAVKAAYRQRSEQLESTVTSLKLLLKDRDTTIEEFKRRETALEGDVEKLRTKHEASEHDKAVLSREQEGLEHTIQELRKDIEKLMAFKRAILSTVDEKGDEPLSVTTSNARRISPRPEPTVHSYDPGTRHNRPG
eukprot:TRINITY_DN6471_c0_g1_i3.p1 TRINITY_DN6471_c0_g1~~TRINITY_DN6471_c0_g1_i3.p1  ORF type:complete len:172 (-),score=17.71 TRINITY_DN6471_c0_g1_i3:25-498(-)